jgi:hypothetical protein
MKEIPKFGPRLGHKTALALTVAISLGSLHIGISQMLQELVPRIDNYAAEYGPRDPLLNRPNTDAVQRDGNIWRMDNTSQAMANSFFERTFKLNQEEMDKVIRDSTEKNTTRTTTTDSDGNTTTTVTVNRAAIDADIAAEDAKQRNQDKQNVQKEIEDRRFGNLRSYDQKYGAGEDRAIANNPNNWGKMEETKQAAQNKVFQDQTLQARHTSSTKIGDEIITINQQVSPLEKAQQQLAAQEMMAGFKAQAKQLKALDKQPGAGTSASLNQTLIQSATQKANEIGGNASVGLRQQLTKNSEDASTILLKKQEETKAMSTKQAAAQSSAAQANSLLEGNLKQTSAANKKALKDNIQINDDRTASTLSFSGGQINPNGWDTNQDGYLDKTEKASQLKKRIDRRNKEVQAGYTGAIKGDEGNAMPNHTDFSSQATQGLSASEKLAIGQAYHQRKKETAIRSTHLAARPYTRERTFDDEGVASQITERHTRRSKPSDRVLFEGTPNETKWERSGHQTIKTITNNEESDINLGVARIQTQQSADQNFLLQQKGLTPTVPTSPTSLPKQ